MDPWPLLLFLLWGVRELAPAKSEPQTLYSTASAIRIRTQQDETLHGVNGSQESLAQDAGRRERLWQRRLALEDRLKMREGSEHDYHGLHTMLVAKVSIFFLKLLGLYKRGLRNACRPVLREERFTYPDLPHALEGFRILHLSDFHFSPARPEVPEAVCALLSGLTVDLCVMTGDFRYGHFGPQENAHEPVAELLPRFTSKAGCFGVLGNHDLSEAVPGLRSAGIHILINEGAELQVGDVSLWIGGVDDPHKFRAASVADAMAGAPDEVFKILLAHAPGCMAEADVLGADLYLCGHTHGGQVRLPLLGAVHTNARCAPEYARHRWRWGKMWGYTTDGLGTTDIPVRYNCPPEAVLITLCSG